MHTNTDIPVHPAHILGILGAAVREHYGSHVLIRGMDRLTFDVEHLPLTPRPNPALQSERVFADLDCDE